MNTQEITDHSLHLLVDDQLDAATKSKLKKEIEKSPELQKKLREITEVKELVALAYLQEKPKSSSDEKQKIVFKSSLFVAMAASLIMAIGLTLGWFAHQQYEAPIYVVAKTDSRAELIRPQIPLEINLQSARKYMLHFDSMNEARLKSALLETSSILDSYASSGLPIKVDLLFDQQSVNMFKPEHASQIQHLKRLIKNYENIQLFACSESIRVFLGDLERSEDFNLFHTDQVVKEMIPQRIEQGWVYIKA